MDRPDPARPLWGLVLAGGFSRRMGQDKGSLVYGKESQRRACFRLLSGVCERVYLSCRADQVAAMEPELVCLPDAIEGQGPIGAILTALTHRSEVGWLVLACDLPDLDEATLACLVAQRRPDLIATAYRQPGTERPEPLVAIWEPASLPLLTAYLASGNRSPSDLLSTHGTHLIDPPRAGVLDNVNTPDEAQAAGLQGLT